MATRKANPLRSGGDPGLRIRCTVVGEQPAARVSPIPRSPPRSWLIPPRPAPLRRVAQPSLGASRAGDSSGRFQAFWADGGGNLPAVGRALAALKRMRMLRMLRNLKAGVIRSDAQLSFLPCAVEAPEKA